MITDLPRIRGSELLVPLARFDSQVYWQSKHDNSNFPMQQIKVQKGRNLSE